MLHENQAVILGVLTFCDIKIFVIHGIFNFSFLIDFMFSFWICVSSNDLNWYAHHFAYSQYSILLRLISSFLKIKVLHDLIEEPFCLNGSIKNFNIWRIFLFHKRFFVVKERSSDYIKVRKRWFFKEPLTEWFFVKPKMVILWHCLKNLLSTFIFKCIFYIIIFFIF